MRHTIGVSGSTIYSAPEKLAELYKYAVDHIEIGEFGYESVVETFMSLQRQSGRSFAIHSPLLRRNSKYDLLETVYIDTVLAWEQFEADIAWVQEHGGAYILVHFPYFHDESSEITNERIEAGLQKLSALQNRYGVRIVCEPKLGRNRSPVGIHALDRFPVERWAQYGISLCIDIGDYLIGCDDVIAMIEKWQDHILVVHLHNVVLQPEHYIWIPIHPSHENDGIHYPIEAILRHLAAGKARYFILEHTPEFLALEQNTATQAHAHHPEFLALEQNTDNQAHKHTPEFLALEQNTDTFDPDRFVSEGLEWLRAILEES